MTDQPSDTLILPADAVRSIITYADRELGRLEQWRTLGVPSARAEAEDLREAMAEASAALNDGGLAALPVETAAVLRLYAGREYARLAGMSAQWGEGNPDLGRQATQLLAALSRIPYVARPLDLPRRELPASAARPAEASEALHG